jgi:hypothetical protein
VRDVFEDKKFVDARYLFFGSALVYSSKEIERNLDMGNDVLVESYIFRTTCFHKGMGATAGIIFPANMPQPDQIVYLYCDAVERKRRLTERDQCFGTWQKLAEDHASAIVQEYDRYPMRKIDTTHRTPDSIAAEIIQLFSEMNSSRTAHIRETQNVSSRKQ